MRAIRFKVFLLRINADLAELNALISKAPFNPEYGSGIEALHPVDGIFSARYHEQNTLVSDLTDVYGNTLQNTVVQYLSFRFYIREKVPNMYEVIADSPPQSMRGFIDFLRRILPIPFAFEGSKIDVYDWYKGLQTLTDVTSVRAIKAQTALVNLDGDSAFKVAVESASDAIGKTEKLVGDQKIVLDRVKISLYYDVSERTIELTRTYGVTVTGFADPYEALRFVVHVI
jgi:hypothetical protein